MDVSILADVFMLISCPGYHSIQCLKLCDINEKKKTFGKAFATQIDPPKKTKGGQKLYDVNVRSIY